MQFVDREGYHEEDDGEGVEGPEYGVPLHAALPEVQRGVEPEWDETLVPHGTSTDELTRGDWYASCPQFDQPGG